MFSGKTHGQDISEYSLIVYGDLGTYSIGQKTFDLIMNSLKLKEALAVIHLGDMGYNLPDHQGNIGDKFLNMIQPLAAFHPYMTVPGNHESLSNYSSYTNRFIMPYNSVSRNSSLFYSLDIGPVHYVFLHTTILLDKNQSKVRVNMKNWLKYDLKKANKNRKSVPWIVTLHHHPLYCSHEEGNKVIREDCEIHTQIIRNHLENIFYQNSVDLVLSAHIHHYERQKPIYKNLTVESLKDEKHLHVNAKAPIHIISGSAGNKHKRNDPVSKTPDDWSVFMSQDYGFGRLTVLNSSCLLWNQFSSESNNLIDSVYIVKTN
jgi:predicted MPP superfamily phosphohydrolase